MVDACMIRSSAFPQHSWFLFERVTLALSISISISSTRKRRINRLLPAMVTSMIDASPSPLLPPRAQVHGGNHRSHLAISPARIPRVLSILTPQLQKPGQPYPVVDKSTYADLAVVPWHGILLHPPRATEWKDHIIWRRGPGTGG